MTIGFFEDFIKDTLALLDQLVKDWEFSRHKLLERQSFHPVFRTAFPELKRHQWFVCVEFDQRKDSFLRARMGTGQIVNWNHSPDLWVQGSLDHTDDCVPEIAVDIIDLHLTICSECRLDLAHRSLGTRKGSIHHEVDFGAVRLCTQYGAFARCPAACGKDHVRAGGGFSSEQSLESFIDELSRDRVKDRSKPSTSSWIFGILRPVAE